ncbi:sodium/proton-translocating pyrophosphatase [Methylococcus geothermalis]|uniref:Sodium-translocating pyrophosphatase n=1 Tax=Methylococcus geothermalis TaxID=2681310 RepID=A0A858Q9T6_9GAMM|nr:sodium/proton-translocating pyrophosphatase [Methylococcus geothermalis]QJD30639.1 sodium-translocating pyrophosphatase [Methylococcus geothermalis]
MNVSNIATFALASGAAGIVCALLNAGGILRKSAGSPDIQALTRAIQDGTRAFMKRQYVALAVVGSLLALALTKFGAWTANGFIAGVVASALAGYIGLAISVRADARTADAASAGLGAALSMAFRSGTATGLLVAGLALSTVAGYYVLTLSLGTPDDVHGGLLGLALGGSLMSVFARTVGGVWAKAAGGYAGDLVGREAKEAAAIGGCVGATAGHAAGTAADVFETFTVALVAAVLLARSVFGADSPWAEFPLLVAGLVLAASLGGACFVRLGKSRYLVGALYRGVVVTVILAGVGLYYGSEWFLGLPAVQPAFSVLNLFSAACTGLVLAGLNIVAAEYHTSKSFGFAKRIAAASRGGPATNVVAGLAAGLKSTGWSIAILCAAFVSPYSLGGGFSGHEGTGLFAVGLAAVAMASLGGVMVAIDGYGIAAQAAHGIAETAGLPDEVRQATASLDAAGQATRPVVQGYAVGAGGLAMLALFAEYSRCFSVPLALNLSDPVVLTGLFAGGLMPYLLGSVSLGAVGSVSGETGKGANATVRGAFKRALILVLVPLAVPLLVGLGGGREALGGMLVGAIVTGLFQAFAMSSGGGAWDSARRYIEDGMYGGSESEAHRAALTGDRVGSACKEAAGSALNPLIKLMGLVSVLIAPLLA